MNHALPLGVDQPSYHDPMDDGALVETIFRTRNRDQLFDRWAFVAQLESRRVPADECSLDCAILGRSACQSPEVCGPCLSTHFSVSQGGRERCDERRELNLGSPLHDDAYEPSGVHGPAGLEFISYSPLVSPSIISAVEVSLSTLDAVTLAPNFEWVTVGATTLVANAAPEHEVILSAYCESGDQDEDVLVEWVSTNDTDASINDGRAQNNHGLHYRFTDLPDDHCSAIEVKVIPTNEDREESAFVISLDEVRVFGRPAP